ncbi:MAG: ATP-binding protein [Deltaproteobacteria bacterium]|nr:ATP-binding protein [Deltaproteobacteria bacterium]
MPEPNDLMGAPWSITVTNLRALRDFRWEPRGLVLLAGRNGAGKSTVLNALELCQTAAEQGPGRAIRALGLSGLLTRGLPEGTDVSVELALGTVKWILTIQCERGAADHRLGERVLDGNTVIAEVDAGQDQWRFQGTDRPRPERSLLEFLEARDGMPWAATFRDFARNLRVFAEPRTDILRRVSPGGETSISHNGGGLWSVLDRWKRASKKYEGRYEWVVQQARKAFPGIFHDLDLEDRSPGVEARLVLDADSSDGSLPIYCAANGLLLGLLHLAEVAECPDGGVVAIDEFENGLHPAAVHSLIESIRERCEARHLTVILTTHSPAVMNQFKTHPADFYLLDAVPGPPRPLPTRLTDFHDEDWLAHFSLGDLYLHGDIARQGN